MSNVDLIYQLIRKDLTAEGWEQADIELAISECVQERVETGANDNTLCAKEMSYLKKDSLQIIAIVIGKSKNKLSIDKLTDTSKYLLNKLFSPIKKVFFRLIHIIGKFFKGMLRFFKRIWKYFLSLIVLGALIGGSFAAVKFYRLNTAIESIESNIKSPNDSIKTEFAFFVLDKSHDWGFKNISNDDISNRLQEYRDSSFRLIESKAYAGHPKWQYRLGQIYFWADKNYYFDKRDLEKAAFWWNESASQGYCDAYHNLGMAYLEGFGVKKDIRKAIELLKLGAEYGFVLSQIQYGVFFEEGVIIDIRDQQRIPSRLNPEYNELYDTSYAKGLDPNYEVLIPKDIEQAKAWWRKAAAQGSENAKERLQKVYN